MAMMEAFVHDPLITWCVFNFNEVTQISTLATKNAQPAVNSDEAAAGSSGSTTTGAREYGIDRVIRWHSCRGTIKFKEM
ncbi:hypothetical protein OSB04_007440, partial [Centaurea solstitialis]